MERQCAHQWSKELETCRTCEGIRIEEVEINSDSGSGTGTLGLRVRTEPLYSYFCGECESFTMVSPARHCLLCDEVYWRNTMDEEIFGF